MDFYNELINLSDFEIDYLVEQRVKYLDDGKTSENDFIGYKADNNTIKKEVETTESGRSYGIEMRCFHSGYIKENTKIIYGMIYDGDGNISNDGNYYYIDNHDYIKDFCKYISKIEISNEYELFEYLLDFLKEYFGYFEQIGRSEMFKLLVDNYGRNINPINEHGLSWFKGKGNALCTEYSIMAQNILSFFGIDSFLVIGTIKTGDEKSSGHAYNLVKIYDGEGDEKNLLVDFCNHVNTYDTRFRLIAPSPFIEQLDYIDQEFVNRLVNNEMHLIFEDYNYMVIGNTLAKISYERNRDYYISGDIYYGIDVKKCKKKKRDK